MCKKHQIKGLVCWMSFFAYNVFLTSFNVSAQTWIKYYPIYGNSGITPAIETYDKGFYVAESDGAYGHIRIYKTDVNGNILWQRSISNYLQSPQIGGIAKTTDGGLLITGAITILDTANDNFLLKLNACGQVEWSKIYALNRYSIGGPVYVATNGDIMVSSFIDIGINYYNEWIFRTDSNGNLKWQYFDNVFLSNMFIDKNENTISTGRVYLSYPNNPNIEYIKSAINKIDTSGLLVWSSNYSVINHVNCSGAASIQTADNGYLTVGERRDLRSTTAALFLIKYDSVGKPEWGRLFGDTTKIENPLNILTMNDSTYLVSAFSDKGTNDNRADLKLFKINAQGRVLKEVTYPNKGNDWTMYNLTSTNDNKYLIAGEYIGGSMFLLKFNSDLLSDTFYSNDKNKYDYLCGHPINPDTIIYLSTDTVHIKVPTHGAGIEPKKYGSNRFYAFPNPTNDKINIDYKLQNDAEVQLEILNLQGQVVFSHNYGKQPCGEHVDEFDAQALAPGIYIYKLNIDGSNYHNKFVKKW